MTDWVPDAKCSWPDPIDLVGIIRSHGEGANLAVLSRRARYSAFFGSDFS